MMAATAGPRLCTDQLLVFTAVNVISRQMLSEAVCTSQARYSSQTQLQSLQCMLCIGLLTNLTLQ